MTEESHDAGWRLIAAAASSLTHGSQRLQTFIDALRRIITEETWRSYTHPSGQHHTFTRLGEFIEHQHGLNADTRQVRNLVRDELDLLGKLDAEIAGDHGGDRHSDSFKTDNMSLEAGSSASSDYGTSRAYRLRRLERDAPEHYQRVLTGELSVNRAMIESGLQKPKPSIPQGTHIDDVAAALHRRYSTAELDQLRKLLDL